LVNIVNIVNKKIQFVCISIIAAESDFALRHNSCERGMPQSQSKLENEVDKLLDRIFTVDMLMHPEKMDEQEMGEIKIDRSAEYKADQFLDWADRSRCLIMHYKIVR